MPAFSKHSMDEPGKNWRIPKRRNLTGHRNQVRTFMAAWSRSQPILQDVSRPQKEAFESKQRNLSTKYWFQFLACHQRGPGTAAAFCRFAFGIWFGRVRWGQVAGLVSTSARLQKPAAPLCHSAGKPQAIFSVSFFSAILFEQGACNAQLGAWDQLLVGCLHRQGL